MTHLPRCLPRQAEAGFTLIESLIALAILSITAVSFLRSTEANITRVSAIEARLAAAWAAQNRLTELELGLSPAEGQVPMLGQTVTIAVRQIPTFDPSLLEVEVTASAQDGSASFHLSGLVQTSAGGGS
jgi:general secretion pathway protein I